MKKVLVCDDDCIRSLARKSAHGYKAITLADGVESINPVEFKSNGETLEIVSVEDNGGEDEAYVIICKEFGLVNAGKTGKAKVSIMYCDDGYMVVTLYSGILVVNINGNPVAPSLGIEEVPSIRTDAICWVTADKLMQYGKYMDFKGAYMYDFEFMYELSGENLPLVTFRHRHIGAEDVDISGGYIAQVEQQKLVHKQAVEAKRFVDAMRLRTGTDDFEYSEVGDDYEDDDEEEDESDYMYD